MRPAANRPRSSLLPLLWVAACGAAAGQCTQLSRRPLTWPPAPARAQPPRRLCLLPAWEAAQRPQVAAPPPASLHSTLATRPALERGRRSWGTMWAFSSQAASRTKPALTRAPVATPSKREPGAALLKGHGLGVGARAGTLAAGACRCSPQHHPPACCPAAAVQLRRPEQRHQDRCDGARAAEPGRTHLLPVRVRWLSRGSGRLLTALCSSLHQAWAWACSVPSPGGRRAAQLCT